MAYPCSPFTLLFLAPGLLAGGKFYAPGGSPPIPYQRALVHHQGGKELLVLQSSFEGDPGKVAWVIPVPGPPEVFVFRGSSLFSRLAHLSQPRVNRYIHKILLIAFISIFFIWLVLLILSLRIPFPKRYRELMISAGWFVVFILVVGVSMVPTLLRPEGVPEVLVGSDRCLGILDARVVRGGETGPLLDWLKARGLPVRGEDERIFGSYVKRGWCFVAVQIADQISGKIAGKIAGDVQDEGAGRVEHLVKPIGLYFEAPEPIYPLLLTGTAGCDTEVLLYVLSDGKMETDARLALEFARKVPAGSLEEALDVEEGSPPLPDLTGTEFLTRYRGRLLPEAMRDDMGFSRALDDEPYPPVKWIW